MQVEVVYALPEKQQIVALDVPSGTTAMDAARMAKLENQFPDLDVENSPLGLFGKGVKPDHVLQAGDRVEIYRPLIADPKEVRKQRAAKVKAEKAAAKNA